MSNLNILKDVVDKDLCVGCGACVAHNTAKNLIMDWNNHGFLIPKLKTATSKIDYNSIQVCPFNPSPKKEVRTENELADLFLKDAPNYHHKIGRYYNTYVGYSPEFRLTSSSGGLASYIIKKLLDNHLVDTVFAVNESKKGDNYYEYAPLSSSDDVKNFSKTRYYPVTLSDFFNKLHTFSGKVAVVGIACFIKAIRLYQHYNPIVNDKISFLIGIICGGEKSSFFAEYLSSKAGIKDNDFKEPQFRIKDYNSTASDYSFGCKDKNGFLKSIKMKELGDMWGTGMFKNNACDFCDDVTTELADISLGDAWLNPYNKDGRGTNVIVTRSKIAEDIINHGITSREILVEPLSIKTFLFSQQGSFNHRHMALGYRVKKAEREGIKIPPKRHTKEKITVDFKYVQDQRMKVRKLSLLLWNESKSPEFFDKRIKRDLLKLKILTKIYHYRKGISRKFLSL